MLSRSLNEGGFLFKAQYAGYQIFFAPRRLKLLWPTVMRASLVDFE